MNATDLTTNDLLSYQGYTFGIVEIYKDSVKLDGGDDIIVDIDDDDLHPIPLTREMLFKNDFVEFGEVYEGVFQGSFYSEDGKIKIDVTNSCLYDLSCGPNVICNLRYVHELQRALRLCGLNELADNFKI